MPPSSGQPRRHSSESDRTSRKKSPDRFRIAGLHIPHAPCTRGSYTCARCNLPRWSRAHLDRETPRKPRPHMRSRRRICHRWRMRSRRSRRFRRHRERTPSILGCTASACKHRRCRSSLAGNPFRSCSSSCTCSSPRRKHSFRTTPNRRSSPRQRTYGSGTLARPHRYGRSRSSLGRRRSCRLGTRGPGRSLPGRNHRSRRMDGVWDGPRASDTRATQVRAR